ncbi:hypothetical protein EN829_047585 [Mesorhizobium sp. M00.F.Ca.ET.186.01.1.1]|nr:hypothetical protein EN829_047585 [Mesorhizobium sp. M00.F.Ca.ET.186.01.1.1]
MADRFIAAVMTSFLFTLGAALVFFHDRFMMLPTAMITFPLVFACGIPASIVIDRLMRLLRLNRSAGAVFVELALYGAAGIGVTVLLFWKVGGVFFGAGSPMYYMGVAASVLYGLCLFALRRKRRSEAERCS